MEADESGIYDESSNQKFKFSFKEFIIKQILSLPIERAKPEIQDLFDENFITEYSADISKTHQLAICPG